MKKNCLRFLAVGVAVVVCIQPAFSRQLSANEALTRALKSGQSSPSGMRKARSLSHQTSVHTIPTVNNDAAAFYVFEGAEGDGFIVASADDRLQPLLGVADSGSYSEIPENMQWWISQYQEEISAYYDANGTDASSDIESVYDLYDSWAPIEPICKTTWDQGSPYNALCPKSGGKATFTGCVATCLAQAIRAIGYMNPNGSKSYNAHDDGTKTFDFSSYKPNFSRLRDSYGKDATDAEREEVANLMLACGVAVNSSYGTSATGAVFVLDGLRNNLGFSDTYQIRRANNSTYEWESTCYSLLKAGRPICYGGTGSGSHAFICDGYSENGLFHFNWGWSGAGNGYFRLSVLDPRHIGTGGFAGGYSQNHNIVVLLGSQDKNLDLGITHPGTVDWNPQSLLGATAGVDKGGSSYISLEIGYMLTSNCREHSLDVGIGLLLKNRDGVSDDIYLAPTQWTYLTEGRWIYNTTVNFDQSLLTNGASYDAYPVYAFKGYEGYWLCKPASSNILDGKDHWLITVGAGGKLSCQSALAAGGGVDVFDMEASVLYGEDNQNKFRCLLTNYSEDDYQKTITLRLRKADGSKEQKIKDAQSWLMLPAGETVELAPTFTLSGVEAGKYQLCIYSEDTNAPLSDNAILDVEVIGGKRPADAVKPAMADNYQVALWVDGKYADVEPMSVFAGDVISGKTCVICNNSRQIDYSLAFFKHGETTNPIEKYSVGKFDIKGNGTWVEALTFSVKPGLAPGVYSMAFVNEKDGIVSVPVDFYVGAKEGGLIYNYNEALGLELAGADGSVPSKIEVPASISGVPVVGVAVGAFDGCTKVEEISLPESITKIGLNAFRGASSLKHVMLPGEAVAFSNTAIPFGSVNPKAEFYVNSKAYEAYTDVFKYRGRLYAAITSLSLPAETEVPNGADVQVPLTVAPSANYNPVFTVKVADPKVATAEIADGKIVVSPKAEGETVVTVTSAQPGVAPASMKVKVGRESTVPVEISLSKTSLELDEDETAELKVELKNAPEGAVATWTSSDRKVAVVDANGKVTAVGAGEAVITASYGDAKAECAVKVTAKAPSFSLSLNETAITLDEGQTFLLYYSFSGDVPKDVEVVWSSSNPAVAKIANGIVTAYSAGETVISATCGEVVASCTVTVVGKVVTPPAPVYGLKLSETSIELTEGETKILGYEFTGESPKDADVVWTSSNPEVATVANGVVTALKAGEAVVTAACGDVKATCTVKVSAKVTPPAPVYGLKLSATSIELTEGEIKILGYEFTGESPKDADVVWTSSNPEVAAVANGVVTALKAGEAVVTAACGDVKATCAVKVSAKPVPTPEYGLKLAETSLELKEGESKILGYEFTGEAPEDAEVVWTSSNETVATVQNGVVTAIGVGEAVITATCGTASATCAVVVVTDGSGNDQPGDDDSIAEVNADAAARYFDLSGRRIASPRGVCIELKNGVARKVMVK